MAGKLHGGVPCCDWVHLCMRIYVCMHGYPLITYQKPKTQMIVMLFTSTKVADNML